jgi:hypothetical protein
MKLAGAILFLLLASSCDTGKHPVRQVQFCLRGEQDEQLLLSVLRRFAAENRMTFFDRSADTNVELREIGAHPGYRVLNLSVRASDATVAGVSNAGLGRYQVTIGFNGPDDLKTMAFANDAVATLQKHWTIVEVPEDRGAFPLAQCRFPEDPQ